MSILNARHLSCSRFRVYKNHSAFLSQQDVADAIPKRNVGVDHLRRRFHKNNEWMMINFKSPQQKDDSKRLQLDSKSGN